LPPQKIAQAIQLGGVRCGRIGFGGFSDGGFGFVGLKVCDGFFRFIFRFVSGLISVYSVRRRGGGVFFLRHL
jgi:hypothetical protein